MGRAEEVEVLHHLPGRSGAVALGHSDRFVERPATFPAPCLIFI